MITKADVEHVALLARLDLTEEQKEMFLGQLNNILGHIARLEELDTRQVEPISHAIPITNVFREDKPHTSLPREAVLANAPDQENGCFKVPKIVES